MEKLKILRSAADIEKMSVVDSLAFLERNGMIEIKYPEAHLSLKLVLQIKYIYFLNIMNNILNSIYSCLVKIKET